VTIRKSELLDLRAAIPFVTTLEHGGKGGKSIILNTVSVSGTIRGCQREIKKIHLNSIKKEQNIEVKKKMVETEMEIDQKLNLEE
jgi:RNase P/RNase MRP subunit POP5